MIVSRLLKQWVLTALLSFGVLASAGPAQDPAACGTASAENERCVESCNRFNVGDARLSACNNFCRTKSKHCDLLKSACDASCEARNDASTPETPETPVPELASEAESVAELNSIEEPVAEPVVEPVAEPEPAQAPAPQLTPVQPQEVQDIAPVLRVAALPNKKMMLRELEKNAEMVAAIRAGNLNAIRRLIEVQGLSPTYVYAYDYNPQRRQFEGKATRLRLSDVFADTNTLRNDAAGLDRILVLFIELGMDVKATLATTVPANAAVATQRALTAWGPSLTMMETARDRAARLRAFEIALQAGLVPNDDFSDWLFAELPLVCGRDRSKFAMQVVDLLMKYLQPVFGPALQDHFWRAGTQGPETVSDVIDLSFAPPRPKNSYEKTQSVLQDDRWEQCVLLSRRINRILMQGM